MLQSALAILKQSASDLPQNVQKPFGASLSVGQGMEEEAAAKKFTASGNDDLILQTCLQLKSRPNVVLLYTNDKMLGIKALQ